VSEDEFTEVCVEFLRERGWQRTEYQLVDDPSLRGDIWTKGDPRAGGSHFSGLIGPITWEMTR
jgi:hypothetical protein